MSAPTAEHESMLSQHTTTTFMRFVIPSIIGLMAVSSAGIVDGLFVGNYIGPVALAAVNLVAPIYSLFFGFCVMLLVGSAVMAGKALGAGNGLQASNIFTKSIVVVVGFTLAVAMLAFLYAESLALLLGARGEVLPLTTRYIEVIAPFMVFMGLTYALSYFARVDDAPNFALFSLITTALTNMVLDALFIKVLGWGIVGAALATGIAYLVGTVLLLCRLLSRFARIRLINPFGSWKELFQAAYNGFSEFINEMSAGLIMFIINWIMMLEVGTAGVAAFTIVNYIIWFSVMISYGTAEALGPLISVNFGAGNSDRIIRFLGLAIGTSVVTGVVVVAILFLYPVEIATAFVSSEAKDTLNMILMIISVIWPTFLFNGINITLSGYFTGMHAAAQSAAVAMSRSLVLPLVLILLFWKLFGLTGAFYALPVAEVLTLILTVLLYKSAAPDRLVAMDQSKRAEEERLAAVS